HGGVLGVGAVDGWRLLAEVLLGAPLGVIRLARAFGPAVAIGVKRDAMDAQAPAALLELGGPVTRPHGAEVGEQRPLGGAPLEDCLDLLAVLDHGGLEVGILLHPLEDFLPVVADVPVAPV